ncbi:transcription factor bHLH92 [Senna tora]|uniref:Transcription factor bHLH92 n=1 Tax=Senna tora TaxID=362788 RepID=A0A834X3E2_9FABA|nr:transcription factor bHLH92 [Senna tora]
MDGFFPDKFLGDIFLDQEIGFGQESFHVGSTSKDEDQPLPPLNQSDFLQYSDLPITEFGPESSHNGLNSNQSAFVEYREVPKVGFGGENCENGKIRRRMIEFLRKSLAVERSNTAEREYEKERGFRHMINERMRRQRQRQCCLALHSILPYGTKNDIKSVIQMAAKEIERLQARRDELQRQNVELEAKLKAGESSGSTSTSSIVELRADNPTSPIDFMLDTMKFLKGLGVNTRSISSNLSPQDLSAILEIETKVGDDGDVERAIYGAASENGWNIGSHDWEVSKRQRIGNEK